MGVLQGSKMDVIYVHGSKYTCDNDYNLLASCILSESVRVDYITSCTAVFYLGNFQEYVSCCANNL